MLSLRKINPMARAVGTMGIVATMVGAVTFAAQPSNVVTLQNNSVSTTTASLAIVDGNSCNGSTTGTVAQGMTVTNLAPGATSSPFAFCLANTGSAALDVSVTSSDNLNGSTVPSNNFTLNIVCGGGSTSFTLDTAATPHAVTVIPGNSGDACTATVTLASGYNGAGGTLPLFNLDFAGTSSAVQPPATTTTTPVTAG